MSNMNTAPNMDLVRHGFTILQSSYLMSQAEYLLMNGVDEDIQYRVGRALEENDKPKGGRFTTAPQPKAERLEVGLNYLPSVKVSHEQTAVEYLTMLNGMTADQVEKEAESITYKRMCHEIKNRLFVDGKVNNQLAELIENHGILVSYNRISGALHIVLKSGILEWKV